METLTSEQETYNKLYTRILCLIVEQFHFELQDMEDFAEVVDLRMELVAQDSLSAKALKQLNFLRKEQERKKMARPSDPEKKEMEVETPAVSAKPTDKENENEAKESNDSNESKENENEAKESNDSNESKENENEAKESQMESESELDPESEASEEEKEPPVPSTSALQSAQEEEIQAELRAASSEAEREEQAAASSNSIELTAQDRRRILRLVLTVVIPDLRKLMVATDEQRNQTVRCGVAVVIIQLLRHLPSKVMEM